MDDFVNNAKLNKITGAEGSIINRVTAARRNEVLLNVASGGVRSLNSCVLGATTAVVLAVTLTAKIGGGGVPMGSDIFAAVGIFNQVRFPVLFYPMVLTAALDGYISAGRIAKCVNAGRKSRGGESLKLQGGNWRRDDGSEGFYREDVDKVVDLAFGSSRGGLVAVVGSVGSGKSDLCKAVVERVPTAGYYEQEVWLPPGKLKDAIVFSREEMLDEYRRVLDVAQLRQDFDSGLLSDDTTVGEGGSSLSGGQKARVALARTIYNKRVVVVDDCFANLDAKVKSGLINGIVSSGVGGMITTNDWDVARKADWIVHVEQSPQGIGKVVKIGRPEELGGMAEWSTVVPKPPPAGAADKGAQLHSQSVGKKAAASHGPPVPAVDGAARTDNVFNPDVPPPPPPLPIVEHHSLGAVGLHNDTHSPSVAAAATAASAPAAGGSGASDDGVRLLNPTLDDAINATVPLRTYSRYLSSAGSPLLLVACVASYGLSNFFTIYQQSLLAKLTTGDQVGVYLGRVKLAAVYVAVAQMFRSLFTSVCGVLAAQSFHRRMMSSLVGAPVAFYEKNPSGQIANRFGKEIDTIDRSLPEQFGWVTSCFLQIAFSSAAICAALSPVALAPLAVIALSYVKITEFFRSGARTVKSIESKTRSPIYQTLSDAKRGRMVIKTLGVEKQWGEKFRKIQRDNVVAFYGMKRCDRFLSSRVESLANLNVLAAALLPTMIVGRSSGYSGWGISQALSITGLLNWTVRCLTETEQMITSTQRIQEIIDVEGEDRGGRNTIENDENDESGGNFVEPTQSQLAEVGWPRSGDIEFKEVGEFLLFFFFFFFNVYLSVR